ncbi:putative Transcription factor HBP-1b(c1) [Corchorus olitorius]|uniref:Transcription factor HBP-1b(C1) n=1 Tax=Corchorus olitorius TaxID=93759 RepID=A0A1R3IXN2_9ROSI|nr:putative Transcription factor HBP-1b(c1) [Corchorus olitorius]
MPSFDTQLPVTNTICTDGSTINSFRVSDFGAFDQSVGFRLEDAVNLSGSAAFNSAKASVQPVPPDHNTIGTLAKSPTSFTASPSPAQVESRRLQLEKVQQTNLVSLSSGNTENWGESNMADGSPRTDVSTDADTDEKNQRFDRGKLSIVAASDSSDRSKSNMDQKTLRRLAQNREAARKSRLRKKCMRSILVFIGMFTSDGLFCAYVQQLESSRLKLTQLEQELQRARQQGIFISSSGDQSHAMGGNGLY